MPIIPYDPKPLNEEGTLPVQLTPEGLTLTDRHGVIMSWTMEELTNPDSLAVAINSANLYIEHNADVVRASLDLSIKEESL